MINSKIILGVNTFHADSSACLVINGKLIAAIEEERLNRIKHYAGFPINAIKECLSISKLKESDITDIALNTKPFSNLIPKTFHYLKNLSFKESTSKKNFLRKKNIDRVFNEKLNLNKKVKFHYIEHHLAHISSAFYPSGFQKAYGLSIDGSGDFVTVALAKCENNKILIKDKIFFPNSLGIFYHAMTQFLGFKNYGDEYKIMGLAAYGKPIFYNKILNNLFINDRKNTIKLNLHYFNHHKKNFKYIADENLLIDQIYNLKLIELFKRDMTDENFRENFACSVQNIYEHFFKKIIDNLKRKNFSKNLVFSGGCALNSSANKMITSNNNNFEKVFINYAPGDNGGAIGAAFVVAAKANLKIEGSRNPYVGSKYEDKYIKKVLENNIYKDKFNYSFEPNEKKLNQIIAKNISEGKVVGWFQGRMEFGPRALGNRSILADPRNPEMKTIINKKIKRRESFRPFAPSVLQEYQTQWFEGNFNSPYMSSLAIVKKEQRNLIPAVTHFDNTSRLQTVNQIDNLKFANLIYEFYKITGVPILLNTSFNENEPIVEKPEEALECILRTDMDLLVINNFIIEKKN